MASELATTMNVGQLFELLCKRLTVSIVENNQPTVKRLKSIVYTNLVNNPVLNEELKLYHEITNNRFSDSTVAKSFLDEVLRFAKRTKSGIVQEEISKVVAAHPAITDTSDLSVLNTTASNSDIYKVIQSTFQHVRSSNPTIAESRAYYQNTEVLVRYLTSEKPEVVKEEQVNIPMIHLVLPAAVKRFNDKYSALSPAKREILQDFLNYRSLDRFKSSLIGRLKKLSTRLEEQEKLSNDLPQIPKLKQKLDEYHAYALTESVNIHDLMLNVCDFIEVVEDIAKFKADNTPST